VLLLTQGTVFAGDYEIVSSLAEGGMGAVYVAKQLSTGKERALKILRAEFVSDARTRDRFTREARAGSQVDSEHVVEVVAAGIDIPTGMPWLAMELLRGEDLESFVERLGTLAPAEVLEIFRQLCHGLAAAHAVGLVHRDLKPENVFLATARRVGVPFTVKLLDFGIAKLVEETKIDATDAVGTPTYMAPEQTEAGRSITSASDVWALGLIAFRLLTGKKYWRAANADETNAVAILREVVFDPMEPASLRAKSLGSTATLSTAFDGWFARTVVRDPLARFANATEALVALEAALDDPEHPFGTVAMPVPLDQPLSHSGDESVPSMVDPRDIPTAREINVPAATRVGPFSKSAETNGRPITSMPPTEDVDTYQRRLSRGKIRNWATVAALVTVVGFGAYRIRQKVAEPVPFAGHETEPNDRAPDANPVPFGARVRGQIGRRLDADRSDRDFFRVTVPAGTSVVQLDYRALPNIAPCLLIYRLGSDDPMLHYCIGQADRSLTVPTLRLDPGDYYIAVLQDRESYVDASQTPVLENVSDSYELSLGPSEMPADVEVEPNDVHDTATPVAPGTTKRGKLAWMRDVDVFCATDTSPVQFFVEESGPRPHGAVLEVTPLGGPTDGIPMRVHPANAKGAVTERDVKSPWVGPKIRGSTKPPCVSLTLARDVWSSPPLPSVPPASDQDYTVRLERP